MSDFGLKISYDGKDVKLVEDLDCVLNSKHELLKGAIYGSGTKVVPDGTTQTVTINHNIGYKSLIKIFAGLSITSKLEVQYSMFFGGITHSVSFVNDVNSLVISFYYNNSIGSDDGLFYYTYFIYKDKLT